MTRVICRGDLIASVAHIAGESTEMYIINWASAAIGE